MAWTTILFDLDGTLVDSIELIVRAAQHALESRDGPRPGRDEIMAGIGKPLAVQFGAWADSPDALAAYISAYRDYQLAHHDALLQPYEGVSGVVAGLRERATHMGVVTSKVEWLAHRALVHVGLDAFFDVVVGLESTQRHKPEPDPILHALDRLGAVPSSAVYVGDSPFDIQAASAAGIASVGVTWGAFGAEALLAAGPTRLATHPRELLSLA